MVDPTDPGERLAALETALPDIKDDIREIKEFMRTFSTKQAERGVYERAGRWVLEGARMVLAAVAGAWATTHLGHS